MKKENSIKAEINVVPFIDVMLVLLIVFMITAPMLTQGIDVSLPKTSFSDSVQQNESVFFIVSMDKDGLLYFTNTDSKNNSSDPTDINMVVSTILDYESNQNDKDIKIFIKADENLPYGKVISLMDSLKKVSKNSIGLMTEQVSI